VYHYPLLMAFLWMAGSIVYRLRRVSRLWRGAPPPLPDPSPGVSVLIPCHNEEKCVRETIEQAVALDYPNYEVIAIDDGSTDSTPSILDELARRHSGLRIVTMSRNSGKAAALTMGALVARHEIIVCHDADAYLGKDAIRWFVWHFANFPRVGAVTGNPRIRNRTTLLGKIQVGEYSTIIGMIKRTQRLAGKVFTVSGVAVAFRKRALLDVGFWRRDTVTEDIDITWRLQMRFWDVRYEERALCWILTPETMRGLWKQRVRWARGGAEAVIRYGRSLFDYKQRRFWPVYIEYALSLLWAFSFALTAVLALINMIHPLPGDLGLAAVIPPGWGGTFLACVCMMQAALALLFDGTFEKGLFKYLFWFIWYPFIYWILSSAATIRGLPEAIAGLLRRRTAVWESPDRGLR